MYSIPYFYLDYFETNYLLVNNAAESSVSYLPCLPPSWAELPTDIALYTRPPPFRDTESMTTFKLEASSRCACAAHCSFFDPSRPVLVQRCRVYGIHQHINAEIELQSCPTTSASKRRFIGPDLRELGLFNYNNRVLVSHELLDDYTSFYTSSETPFSAWVIVMARRYQSASSTFIGEDLFRSIWFSYAKLQYLQDDMKCKQCGDYPETIIWDGVTLAFGRKHLQSSLEPPTILGTCSPVRSSTYTKTQQLIQDTGLRQQIRQMVSESVTMPEDDDTDSEDDASTQMSSGRLTKKQKMVEAAVAHVKLVHNVRLALSSICPALSDLVYGSYGPEAFANARRVHPALKELLRQVR
jgi:hypothetical protein